jgi:hypothetical protein
MKTTKTKKKKGVEMRAEYDFGKAERGKFYRPLDKGYTVRVKQSDGTETVKHYTLAEGAILLEPDVREFFPNSQAVNEALRSLIHLMKQMPRRKYNLPKQSARQVVEK